MRSLNETKKKDGETLSRHRSLEQLSESDYSEESEESESECEFEHLSVGRHLLIINSLNSIFPLFIRNVK